MKWLKITGIAFVGIVLVIFALMGLLYALRGTPARTVIAFGDPAGPPAVSDSTFTRSIELLTQTEMQAGHRVTILHNGDETFPLLWKDLRAARHSINLHLYYWQPGKVADSLKAVVSERARAGVRVMLLLDAFGAQPMSDGYIDSLQTAGVRTAQFRPLKWYTLHKAQNRSHMRLIVIDDSIGYTGGFGIADHWLGNGRTGEGWRDSNVRFTGPAVGQMQAMFAVGWAEATGVILTGRNMLGAGYARSTPKAKVVAGLLHGVPTIGSTPAERFLVLSIAGAKRRLYISNAYFVPDGDQRKLLIAAARRGVDVRILTAGPKTDVKTVRYASHRHYEELLAGGIRIFEYQPVMLHSKTLVADGIWGTVGTMNFDNRSLAFNEESNLLVHDSVFAQNLERDFLEDLRHSKEFKLAWFRQRSIMSRLLEGIASIGAKLL